MTRLPHYATYVNHMLRYYVRHPHADFKTDVDRLNWTACHTVLKRIGYIDAHIIADLYLQPKLPVDDITKRDLWGLVTRVTRLIAEERGLI